MDLFSNDGHRLETVADWRDRGAPARSSAWAQGRSARELATAWIEGDAESRVTALLTSEPELAGLVLDRGVADKETGFDDIADAPHRHDLLVVGRAPSGPVVIGVEGKADEPFDEPLDAWLFGAQARSGGSRAAERLDRLTDVLFGTTLERDPLLAPLRYRLLEGLAGTLAAAREQAARRGVLLVHEFLTPWSDDALHRRNAEELEAFVGRLMPGAEASGDESGWIAGPVVVDGDGTWLPQRADVWVAKLVTSVR